MIKNSYKTFIIIFSCLLFLGFPSGHFGAEAQGQLKITFVGENNLLGGSISARGESSPGVVMLLSIKDENDTFTYTIKTNSDGQGNWSAEFGQLLKSGKYYVEAAVQNADGSSSPPARSELISIKGPFSLIIGIFSFLVIILLIAFVSGWYASKLAEIKRYRRVLISQRDMAASYDVLKNDVSQALKNLTGEEMKEGKTNETIFFLRRISENLEKMNKYLVKGIKIISKYDIINKIENRRR